MTNGLFEYLWLLAHNSRRRDFLDMGWGIEARYKRCQSHWRHHLEFSREFQRQSIRSIELEGKPRRGKIAVLGAGRLYDVDLEFLISKYDEVHLYDADPSIVGVWKKSTRELNATAQIFFHLQDLTGVLDLWTSEIKKLLKSKQISGIQELVEFLLSCQAPMVDFALAGFDAIVSLNLLSQISVYWRDRVLNELEKSAGIVTDREGNLPQEIDHALTQSLRSLELAHLQSLQDSKAQLLMLICDTHFLYYRQDSSHWQEEAALRVEVKLDDRSYRQIMADSWLWHLAPQGIEQPDYGIMHEVVAHAWVKV